MEFGEALPVGGAFLRLGLGVRRVRGEGRLVRFGVSVLHRYLNGI
jgi:hypothetical protein